MIESHKELVEEVKNFSNKMELINNFSYIKDAENISKELENKEPRVFVLGLQGMSFGDEDYNCTVTYKFAIADSTIYQDDSIVNAETENMFIVSALKDFLNYVQDTDTQVVDCDFTTESTEGITYVTTTGSFDVLIKRSPSFWKKLEEYSTKV